MTHLLYQGLPLCQSSIGKGQQCQYPTRREAFAQLLKLEKAYPGKDLGIARGICPTSFRPCPVPP